ncbi:hypothetical protein Tco_0877668 [Tanacetum coccineum]|uniref:Reverse transcriptase domain-containing protein n=1 Tax=Tanacetum coccineum TaxID=301880 RepID=A0ABQ5BYQ1_9ASTR
MDDNRTMAQMLEAPTVGYEDAIVVPEITADNFELKNGLLTLVQNKQFFGHDKEDPHAHIRYFNKITSTDDVPIVPIFPKKSICFSDVIDVAIPLLFIDPIVSTSVPTLTPFWASGFHLFEEVDAFLALKDDPTSPKVDDFYYDSEGDILLLESFLNDDPSPLPNQGNYLLKF